MKYYSIYDKDESICCIKNNLKEVANFLGITLGSLYSMRSRAQMNRRYFVYKHDDVKDTCNLYL